ncbi:MAG TPA: hypothetical protein VIH58_04645 [Chthoniobacterales bacterium]
MSSESITLVRNVLKLGYALKTTTFMLFLLPFKTSLAGSRFSHRNVNINEVWGWL